MNALPKTTILLGLLSLAAPSVLARLPDDCAGAAERESATIRFRVAQQAAKSGDYVVAKEEYAKLILEEPNNVDYMFGYAQTLFWSDDIRKSTDFLSKARQLAPDYEAIWKLEFRARMALARDGPDQQFDDFRRLAEQRFPEADWHRNVDGRRSRVYRWEVSASREYLDNDAPDWTRIDASVSRHFAKHSLVMLSASEMSRFDTTDIEARLIGSWSFGDTWTIGAGVAGVSEPNFLPETSVEVLLNRRFSRGWVGGIRWRHRDYSTTSVESAAVSAEYYFKKFRVAYSVESARLESENAFVNTLAFNVYGDTGYRFDLVVAAGDEIEVISPGELLRTEVQSVAIAGRHPISSSLGVGWRLGTHRQGDFYRRNAVGFSIFGAF